MAPKPKRPLGVTCVLGLVLMFTGIQLLRLWVALASWNFLTSLPLRVPPAFFIVSGLACAVVGVWLANGLWTAKIWAPRAMRIAAFSFAAFHWFDRLVLQVAGPQSANWPFDALLTAILLASVLTVLALPQARAYFGVTHD